MAARADYAVVMAKLPFIGLGVMGGPMARHLTHAGHELTVYNRTCAKAEAWVAAHGGTVADSPAKAAEGVEAVISCVGTDEDLAAVTVSRDGAFRSMKPGSDVCVEIEGIGELRNRYE